MAVAIGEIFSTSAGAPGWRTLGQRGLLAAALVLAGACAGQDMDASDSEDAQDSQDPSENEASDQPKPKSSGSNDEPGDSPEPSPEEDDASPEADPGEEEAPDSSTKFDLGVMPEAEKKKESDELRPCEIDFLFVVDNSISMEAKQRHLIASVPEFIDTMMNSTDLEKDFHIGVVTTDQYRHNSRECGFLGGLVTQVESKLNPSDTLPKKRQCGPYKSGLNFMTHEDDLKRSFACAARPGVMGSVEERQIGALFAAVDPKNGAKGRCNEGFVREEALLVAVIITDENDLMQPGTPKEWHDQLVKLKGDDPKKVVVVSIVVPEKNACTDPMAQVSKKILTFTKEFGKRGFIGDVCTPGYENLFKQAIGVIDFACGELVDPPPG